MITKEETIQRLKDAYNINALNTAKELIAIPGGKTTYRAALKYFGSFYEARNAIGVDNSKTAAFKITEERCIEKLKRIYAKYGKVTYRLIDAEGSPTSTVYEHKFGSIRNALALANIPVGIGQRKNVSKEEIDAEIMRLQNEYGYVSKPLFEKCSAYSPKIVQRIYGSFEKMYIAMQAYGVVRHPSGRIPSDEELKNEFLKIYNQYGIISQSIIESESQYSITCYKDRFGSINKLRQSLGIETVLSGTSTDADYVICQIEKILNENAEKEKTFEWLINPKTNMHLRIDAYFPAHKLAVEYNGPQHYHIDTMYTKSKDELDNRKYLDELKIKLLQDHKISVYTIRYDDKKDIKSLTQQLRTIQCAQGH